MSTPTPFSSSTSSSGVVTVLPVEQVKNKSKKIGKALAEAVLRETVLKREIRPTEASQRLVSAAPDRSQLSFSGYGKADQKRDEALGQDTKLSEVKQQLFKSYIKVVRARDVSISAEEGTNKDTLLFSMPDGELNSISTTDIEHATSYKMISENINTLLDFLNQKGNEDVKKAFLEYEDEDESGITIQQLFGTKDDSTDEPIQARQYLYTVCYNQEKNLWIIGHDSNMKKSDNADWVEWCETTKVFKGQYLDEVEAMGGVQKGLIFEFIPTSSSKMINIPGFGEICREGDGLGEYTHNWFMANRSPYFDASKRFHNEVSVPYGESKDKMLQDMDAGKSHSADIRRRQQRTGVRRAGVAVQQVTEERTDNEAFVLSDTGSQSDDDKAVTREQQREVDEKGVFLKKIEIILNKAYPGEEHHEFFSDMRYEKLRNQLILDNTELDSLLKILDEKATGPAALTLAEIQTFIQENLITFQQGYEQEKSGRLVAEQRADTAEQQAAVERQARLAAQQEADAERQARLAEQQRTQAMQRNMYRVSSLSSITSNQYNKVERKPFETFQEFGDWRNSLISKLLQNQATENSVWWVDHLIASVEQQAAIDLRVAASRAQTEQMRAAPSLITQHRATMQATRAEPERAAAGENTNRKHSHDDEETPSGAKRRRP